MPACTWASCGMCGRCTAPYEYDEGDWEDDDGEHDRINEAGLELDRIEDRSDVESPF